MSQSRSNVPLPSYIDMPVIDVKTGMFTAQWKEIMQQLLTTLNQNMGDQGIVMPPQTAADIGTIENAKTYIKTAGSDAQYICQFGTVIYNSTNNVLVVALDNGSGVPVFHNIVTL